MQGLGKKKVEKIICLLHLFSTKYAFINELVPS